jgi:Mn-dependent DtxR family transcriptional regulator
MMAELGRSQEDYLEAILILKMRKGEVHCVDIADFMKFSRPSVSYAIKELRKKEFVEMNRDASLELSEKGRVLAEKIYERHEFFKKVLIEAGVQQDIAEKEGCFMEHVLCDDSFQKLKKHWNEKIRK